MQLGPGPAETCALDIASIRTDGWVQVADVVGKGDKPRRVELPPRVAHAVGGAAAGRQVGPLILNDAGNRITKSNLRHRVEKITAAAGIDKHLSPHCLRRTFIQLALDAGAPVRDVQLQVGHADSATTSHYDRSALTPGKSPAYAVQMLTA